MQEVVYEGYFNNGHFYSSGKIVQIPEQSRVVITILENAQDDGSDKQALGTSKKKRTLGFLDIPPLPNSFLNHYPMRS